MQGRQPYTLVLRLISAPVQAIHDKAKITFCLMGDIVRKDIIIDRSDNGAELYESKFKFYLPVRPPLR